MATPREGCELDNLHGGSIMITSNYLLPTSSCFKISLSKSNFVISAQIGIERSPTGDFFYKRVFCYVKNTFLQWRIFELTSMRRSCSFDFYKGSLSITTLLSKMLSMLEESSESSYGFFFTLFLLLGSFSSGSESISSSSLNYYSSGISSYASYMFYFYASSIWRQYEPKKTLQYQRSKFISNFLRINLLKIKQINFNITQIGHLHFNKMQINPEIRMQDVRKQNQRMERIIQGYLEEIQKQKQLNLQKENQIENLLKFNERLLNIIQTEMVNTRKDNGSLMPISEKSERQSDLMNNPLNSLIKTKKTIAARSQKGTKSVIQNNSRYFARLEAMGKNLENSQFVRSQDIDDSFLLSVREKPFERVKNEQNDRKYSDMTTKIESDLSHEMKNLYTYAQRNTNFYEEKISQLRNLSNKIEGYKPEDMFNQLSQKINLSPATTNLVKKAMLAKKN